MKKQNLFALTLTLSTSLFSAHAFAQIETKVVDGTKVNSKEWIGTHTVALIEDNYFICTATLLSSKVALTAAHCISGNNYSLGFNVNENSSSIVKRKVTKTLKHPDYRRDYKKRHPSDIALVFFSGGIPKPYKPVSFLGKKEVAQRGSTITIAGYGSSNRTGELGAGILRKGTLKVLESSEPTSEVTLDQKSSQAACYGDSGGPAFLADTEKTFRQVGVASRVKIRLNSNGKRECGDTSTYTRIGFFEEWILSEMAK